MELVTHCSLILSIFLLLFISPSISTTKHDLLVATQEMQRANYFTFVLLINMSPPDKIPANITFLMPNDRMLAKTAIPENAVTDFLLRHSIPSALLFDHLERFPTNSIVPSSRSDYVFKILNNGRRSFFLNNAKLISPNICVTGSSIRCHGIDGVLLETSPLSCTLNPGSSSSSSSPPPMPSPKQPSSPTTTPVEPSSPIPPLILPPELPETPPPANWSEARAPEPADSGIHEPRGSGALRLGVGGTKEEYVGGLVMIMVLLGYVW